MSWIRAGDKLYEDRRSLGTENAELRERIRELESAISLMKQAVNDLAGEKHDSEARVKALEAKNKQLEEDI